MSKTVIRCKIHRDGGTRASIDGKDYHFRPRPDLGATQSHVCAVAERSHVKRFLQITEGYELFLGEDDEDAPGDVVAAVPDDAEAAEPAPEPDEAEETAEDDGTDEGDDDAKADWDAPLEEQSDDALRALFKTLNHGRAPRGNPKRETLIEKIREMQAAQA